MTKITQLSKFISKVLRHEPHLYGLVLDADGFTSLDELKHVLHLNFREAVTDATLQIVLTEPASDGNQRFERVGDRVRARYGHSLNTPRMAYPSVMPPAILYHGTSQRVLSAILQEGLQARSRQYVHLTNERSIAERVGERHGKLVLLEVNARMAHVEGVAFYLADEHHYLVNDLPARYLRVIEAS